MKLWLSNARAVALIPDLLPTIYSLNQIQPGDIVMVMAWDQIRLWLNVFGKLTDSDVFLCASQLGNDVLDIKKGSKISVRFSHIFMIERHVNS